MEGVRIKVSGFHAQTKYLISNSGHYGAWVYVSIGCILEGSTYDNDTRRGWRLRLVEVIVSVWPVRRD